MSKSPLTTYLAGYAEPEIHLIPASTHRWDCAVVVPLFDESAYVIERLKGSLLAASLKAVKQLIIIWVVNRQKASSNLSRNLEALKYFGGANDALFFLEDVLSVTHLVIDRTSPGRELPDHTGVGLARKIGCDVALELFRSDKLSDHWIRTTDADAEVPQDYLLSHEVDTKDASAIYYPYEHVFDSAHSDAELSLILYEIKLRYYVMGLKSAGSPYAFPTLGSTLCIDCDSYAKVRGFPKLEAGEDFYLLSKLAQVGRIVSSNTGRIRIHQRVSNRTPFGTGAAITSISQDRQQGKAFTLYAPESFALLKSWLEVIALYSSNPDIEMAKAWLEERDPRLLKVVVGLGALKAMQIAKHSRTSKEQIARHLHEWFDALKTLRFIHSLRELGTADVNYEIALAAFLQNNRGGPKQRLESLRLCVYASPSLSKS